MPKKTDGRSLWTPLNENASILTEINFVSAWPRKEKLLIGAFGICFEFILAANSNDF